MLSFAFLTKLVGVTSFNMFSDLVSYSIPVENRAQGLHKACCHRILKIMVVPVGHVKPFPQLLVDCHHGQGLQYHQISLMR